MAKWLSGASVVGLYFLLSFCLIICSTSELEKAGPFQKVQYSDVKFMNEYKSIQNISNFDALEQTDHIFSEENKTQDVKEKLLGAGTVATLKKAFTNSKTELDGDIIHEPDAESLNAEYLLMTNFKELRNDYHYYYNHTMVVNEALAKEYWNSFKNISANTLLSKSHRRAVTVQLSFDFPFYGHPVRNVTVATGGFLYTGEYVHSWLAKMQYIAPLMANFDTSLSNDSFVKFADNGTAFTAIWENVFLHDREDIGSFTFSTTLHKNGDIVFAYFSVPISILSIHDDKHPVKVGVSDAYIIDKVFSVRRKTIYEYLKVNFGMQVIQNCTIIFLKGIY